MEVSGRDGDAYLVTDGPVGAIVGRGLPSAAVVLPVASILAHREFDPYDGSLPAGVATVGLVKALADARVAFEAGDPTQGALPSDTSSAGVP